MSLLSRIKAVFQAGANDLTRGMEDPKVSLDYSLYRLEESLRQINRSLVDVSAAGRRLESQRGQLLVAEDRYLAQAQAAVDAGRDDLARVALERRQEARLRGEELDVNLNSLNRQLEGLKETQANLERKIALFQSKKEELKAIYDASRAQVRMREAVSGISSDLADVGSTIQRAEARILEMQSRAEAIEGLMAEGVLPDLLSPGQDDVDRELSRINRKQLVDEELARLKGEDYKLLPYSDK